MTDNTRFDSDTDQAYIKSRKTLIKMFQPYVNEPDKQLPMVIDSMSLFMAGLDGNGFYGLVSDDVLHHHQQYDNISIEILTLGIKAYMKKNKLDVVVASEWPFPSYLNIVLKKLGDLNKQLKAYTKKKNK